MLRTMRQYFDVRFPAPIYQILILFIDSRYFLLEMGAQRLLDVHYLLPLSAPRPQERAFVRRCRYVEYA
jgi:hypothetical protein